MEKILTKEQFKKEIKTMRLTKRWYQFTGFVDGKTIVLKGFGTWLQIFKVNGIDNSNAMDQKVSEFDKHIENTLK